MHEKFQKNIFKGWLLFIGIILIILFIFLYQQKYLNCLSIDFIACVRSLQYKSYTGQFSFRYPYTYPLIVRKGEQIEQLDGNYDEFINFSTEFYHTAGGERLGSLRVTKKTEFASVQEYADKVKSDFDSPLVRAKVGPPKIISVKIGGRNAVRMTSSGNPSNFGLPRDEYAFIENGKLYSISFDYNAYYHKQPFEYYDNSKKIILSTFTFN